jgi:hypothetical protein
MLTPTASPDTTTSYSIVATDANGCIASDDVQIIVSEVFNNESICIVSVDTLTWKNKVVWKKTSGVGTESFNIYKETAVNVYDLIGNVDYADEPLYVDAGSSPEAHGDKYKITAVDTCGEESALSPFHKTMNLTIAASGNTMGLNWDNYVDESGTFVPARYYIFRGSNPNLMTLLDSVSGSFTSYNDVNVFVVYHYLIGVKKLDDCGLAKSSQTMSYSNKKDNTDFIGIEDNLYSAGIINISPNPMSTSATLTIPNWHIANSQRTMANGQLQIMDLTGKLVRTIPLSPHGLSPDKPSPDKPSHAHLTIERGNLKPGVYFVELKADRIYRGKLVVE